MIENGWKNGALAVLLLWSTLFVGCAAHTGPSQTDNGIERFSLELERLGNLLLRATVDETGLPMAVLPGSLASGTPYSRLEEMLIHELSMRLARRHEIVRLSRQNWFEYLDGRPLSFRHGSLSGQELLEAMTIIRVDLSPDEIRQKLTVSLTRRDTANRSLTGGLVQSAFDYQPNSPARQLMEEPPLANPQPEGMEAKPYRSVERLAFHLASELTAAYRTGITMNGLSTDDHEIRVVLLTESGQGIDDSLDHLLRDALQQAIIASQGFTCAVSREDFSPVFKQLDFYKDKSSLFRFQETTFSAATVFLLADISRLRPGAPTRVALRALWRQEPTASRNQDLLGTDAAGHYLSGFTAQAYLDGQIRGAQHRRPNLWPMGPETENDTTLNRGFD